MRGLVGDLLLLGVVGFVAYVVIGKLKQPVVAQTGAAQPTNEYDVQAGIVAGVTDVLGNVASSFGEWLNSPDPDNQDTGGSAFNWDELSGGISDSSFDLDFTLGQ